MAKELDIKLDIDWNELKSQIADKTPKTPATEKIWFLEDGSTDNEILDFYKQNVLAWKKAGYSLDSVYWNNYYPQIHYDDNIHKTFEDKFHADTKRSWISEIVPGKFAPYHWDVDDRMFEWTQEGKIIRLTCFIDQPVWGSFFIIEDRAFYAMPQGTLVQWDNWDSYHGGAVCGLEPQCLFHYIGVLK